MERAAPPDAVLLEGHPPLGRIVSCGRWPVEGSGEEECSTMLGSVPVRTGREGYPYYGGTNSEVRTP